MHLQKKMTRARAVRLQRALCGVACAALLLVCAGCNTAEKTSSAGGETTPTASATQAGDDARFEKTKVLSTTGSKAPAQGLKEVKIDIRVPDEGQDLKIVDAAQFGMSTDSSDNTDALMRGVIYCGVNPGSKLVIPKGRYMFDNSQLMQFNNLNNVIIDGQGSEFIFRDDGMFYFKQCDTVEIRNLIIDWDWEYYRPANLVEIVDIGSDKDGDYIDYKFIEVDAIDPVDVIFHTMTRFDPVTLTPGLEGGKEIWEADMITPNVVSVSDNVLRAYGQNCRAAVAKGEIYLLRNYSCKRHAFEGNDVHNFSFNNVTIYGSPGMGFVFSNGSSHVRIYECLIGLRPGEESKRRLSSQADALHCLNTGGNFWFEKNEFSFMEDDNINIHDNVGLATGRHDDKTLIVQKNLVCYEGDTVLFRNSDYSPSDFTAVITGIVTHSNDQNRIEFDREVPSQFADKGILQNTRWDSRNYIIRDNYFHDNRARGILAQAGNGVIENNRFLRTQGPAIMAITEIAQGLWSEGTGVDNLTIRGNTFENCNVSDWTSVIDIHSSVFGQGTEYPLFTNIMIEDNEFIDFPSYLIKIESADNVTFQNNTIRNVTPRSNEKNSRGRSSVQLAVNVVFKDNVYVKSALMRDTVLEPQIFGDESKVQVTSSGNSWKEE